MRRLASLALVFLLGGAGCPSVPEDAAIDTPPLTEIDMDDYLWKNRPLLVFGPSDSDPRYQTQLDEFEGRRTELDDRDIVLLALPAGGRPSVDERPLAVSAVSSLRQRYEVPADNFAVILIGKDGGVKLREDEPVAARQVFDLIDSMPMRQAEMRRQASD
jgi:hypothetical protein